MWSFHSLESNVFGKIILLSIVAELFGLKELRATKRNIDH